MIEKTFRLLLYLLLIVTFIFMFFVIKDYKNKEPQVIEKVIEDAKKQDSLLIVIKTLEDSLNNKKVKRIKEIEIRYEKTIDSIRALSPTQQVELLTRNLSEVSEN